MKIKVFRIVTLLLLILLMTVIFNFSSQTANQSSQVSGRFTYKVFSVLYPHFDEMSPEEKQQTIDDAMFYVRKTAHMGLYFVLGVLSFLTFVSYFKLPLYVRATLSFLLCVLYSCTDEFHQTFVAGRSGELRDVLIDSTGAFLSVVLLSLLVRFIPKLKNIVKGEK